MESLKLKPCAFRRPFVSRVFITYEEDQQSEGELLLLFILMLLCSFELTLGTALTQSVSRTLLQSIVETLRSFSEVIKQKLWLISTKSCFFRYRNESLPWITSFHLIPVRFFPKVCFRLIDDFLRFLSSMTITEPMFLFGQHNASVLCGAVVQRLLRQVELLTISNAYQRSTSSLQGIENFVQESNDLPRDTRYSPLATKYFLWEAATFLTDPE